MFLKRHDCIEVGDYLIPFNNDFKVFLSAQRILSSADILDDLKIDTACSIIYPESIPEDMKPKAVENFFKTFSGERKVTAEPVFDLEQDKELIYAGFLQTYKIDLDTAKLSIEQFLALLRGLPENTKFAETVKIRVMPVPAPTKYNAQQRSAILRAKDSVALKKNRQSNLAKGWRSLGQLIKGMARKNGE